MFELKDNGTLTFDGIAIGTFDDDSGTLSIDLGWAKAASMNVIIRDDPEVDHHRRGIFLQR